MMSSEINNPGPSSVEFGSGDEEHPAFRHIPKLTRSHNDCDNVDEDISSKSENCTVVHTSNDVLKDKFRRSRKKHSSQQNCPSCGITLQSSNIMKHFLEEKERLIKCDLKRKKLHARISMRPDVQSIGQPTKLKKTVKRIAWRRRNRIVAQHELLKPWMNIECPQCHLPLTEPDDFLHHSEICASIQEDSTVFQSNESTENNNSNLEETMRFAHASSKSVIHLTHSEEIENIDIETQIEDEFGSQQYFSDDVIPINSEDIQSSNHNEEEADKNNEEPLLTEEKDEKDIIINSLRMKIYELEKRTHHESFCAVCVGPYEVPLVSVNCWHVYCEKCWLTTLEASSLCPLCKVITNVRHLRRIFI